MDRHVRILVIIFSVVILAGMAGILVTASAKAPSDALPWDDWRDGSDLFGHTGIDDMRQVEADAVIPDGFTEIASVGDHVLHMEEDGLKFVLEDTTTGYLWHSYAPDTDVVELNSTLRMQYTSPVVIEYYPYQSQTEELSRTTKRESLAYTDVSVSPISGGVSVSITWLRLDISLTMNVTLDDDGLVVTIPDNSIIEGENKLASVALFPNFASTRDDIIPGYFIIPDGVGALHRFKSSGGMESVQLNARFYGPDRGIILDGSASLSMRMTMPVFGAVHGTRQHGVLGIIEDGDAYAQLIMAPSGTNGLPYNTIHTRFIQRETFVFPTNLKGDGITAIQDERNVSDMTVRYMLSAPEDSDYIGIARLYRSYLEDRDILSDKASDVMDMRLEVLMSDSERGLLGIRDVRMTSFDEASSIIGRLVDAGITPDVILKGWNNDGYSGQMPYDHTLNRALGSGRDQNAFLEHMKDLGIDLRFYTDPVTTYGASSRVSSRTDLARGLYRRTITDMVEGLIYNERHHIIPSVSQTLMEEDARFYESLGVGAAVDQAANLLFGVYGSDGFAPRQESVTAYTNGLEAFGDSGLYRPNAYAWKTMDAYYDVPIHTSQFTFYDDTVPFLPVVLGGAVDLYSPLVNFFADPGPQILRLIDYGIQPSFVVTEEASHLLKFTAARTYFSTSVEVWEPVILSVHDWMSPVFEAVAGSALVSRDVPASGIVTNTYENGVVVHINYTDRTYASPDGDVLPGAYVIGGAS